MKQQSNAPRENYFQQNIAKYGENFLRSKSAKDIQKDAKRRLFKDMVYGNINYDEYGKFFTDPQFIDNLIVIANTLYLEHLVTGNALMQFAGMYNNPVASQLSVRNLNVALVFNSLMTRISEVKANNYDIKSLVQIVSDTAMYRNDFSELY